jgi:hypothetical protein
VNLHALGIGFSKLLLADHRGKCGILGVHGAAKAKGSGEGNSRNNGFDVHFDSLL